MQLSTQLLEEFSTGIRLANIELGLGAELVNIANGRRTQVEKADEGALPTVADETGQLRFKVRTSRDATGNIIGRFEYVYRPLQGGVWHSFGNPTS